MPSLYPLLVLAVALAADVLAQQACNGHAEYCGMSYADVSQIGNHDSAFVGILPTDNQDQSVTDQLNAGIRFLQGQTHHDFLGTLSMCHTTCWEEDAGSVVSYLSEIKRWMDGNPNEVVTVLLTNGDGVATSEFDSAYSSAGLKGYVYAPTTDGSTLPIGQWPTLGQLIAAGTRLVAFQDYGATPAQFPYILDEFSYFFETPYDTLDLNFAECTLDRPSDASPDGRMYIVNHFLDLQVGSVDIPYVALLPQTNAATGAGSIGAQVSLCEGIYGWKPKFVLVDYFDVGNVFAAELALNGLGGSSSQSQSAAAQAAEALAQADAKAKAAAEAAANEAKGLLSGIANGLNLP